MAPFSVPAWQPFPWQADPLQPMGAFTSSSGDSRDIVMMHRAASGVLHGLLRISITATEAPASACSGSLVGSSLLQGLLDGSMYASQLPVRTIQAVQQRAMMSGSQFAGARIVTNSTAASSWPSGLCRSVISRQLTSLRELAPAARAVSVRQPSGRRLQSCSWLPPVQPLLRQQVRSFAAQSSSGGRVAAGAAAAAASGSRRTAQRASVDQKSSSQALYLVAMIVGMVGVTYASVPLYRMFCQATGYGGTVAEGRTVEAKLRARDESPDAEVEAAAAAREITVSFNADVNDNMPWKFQPTQRSIKLRPGQSTLAFYTAENTSDRVITGVSTYNVTPQQAGFYFNKIQCFCFEEQKLRPGEKIDMPVFFYVDPEFATDPRMRKVNHLTLSYTFFKVSDQTVEEDAAAEPASSTSMEAAQHAGGVLLPAAAGG